MKQKTEPIMTHKRDYDYNCFTPHLIYEVSFKFLPHGGCKKRFVTDDCTLKLTRYFKDYILAKKYSLSVLSKRNRFWVSKITTYRSFMSISFLKGDL